MFTIPSQKDAEKYKNTETQSFVPKLYFRTAEEITEQDGNISIALLNSLLNTKCLLHLIRQ